MAKAKKQTKATELSQKEKEKIEILKKANEVKGEQLFVDISGEIIKEKEFFQKSLNTIDDPKEKYILYYKKIRNLLMKHLPEGDKFRHARDIIYEEKNTFLTRGHRKDQDGIRHADSRMGHIPDAEIILSIIVKWIISNGTPFELWDEMKKLNTSKGY